MYPEVKKFLGKDYNTIDDWANAHIGEIGRQAIGGYYGKIVSWKLGENKNGVWFTFLTDDNIESVCYKQIPKKFRRK